MELQFINLNVINTTLEGQPVAAYSPPSLNRLISRVVVSQTKFIEKNNNSYYTKWIYYENISHGVPNGTNLLS